MGRTEKEEKAGIAFRLTTLIEVDNQMGCVAVDDPQIALGTRTAYQFPGIISRGLLQLKHLVHLKPNGEGEATPKIVLIN